MSPRLASLYILGSALLWSLGGVLIKGMTWDPLAIAGTRSFIAGLIFLAAFYKKISPKWSLMVILGACFYAATVITFVVATKLTTAANAIVLEYAAPIYLAVISPWLLKEKIYAYDWVAIALGLTGVCFTLWSDLSLKINQGDLLGLLSGLLFAGLIVCMRKIGKKSAGHYATVEVVLLGNLLASFICLALMPATIWDFQNGSRVFCLGIIQMALPYFLYSQAIGSIAAIEATLLQMIEPVLNPVWVFLAMGERPGLKTLWGGLLILGATLLRTVWQKMRTSQK